MRSSILILISKAAIGGLSGCSGYEEESPASELDIAENETGDINLTVK